jgi:hypothetical protein
MKKSILMVLLAGFAFSAANAGEYDISVDRVRIDTGDFT